MEPSKRSFRNSIKAQAQVILSLFLSLAFTTSCSSGEESEVKVTMPGATTYALPTTGTSCAALQAGDIAKDSFSYRNITINFTNATDSLYVLAIKVEFKSLNLSQNYTCTISGDELGALFAQNGLPWDGNLYQKDATHPTEKLSITNVGCALKCGGIKYPDGTPQSSTVGTVTVIGIQRSPTGEEKPVKGSTQVKLNFGGI